MGNLTTLTKSKTELRKLKLDEVSGVDDPAHGTPGWLMLKSAEFGVSPDELEELVRLGKKAFVDNPRELLSGDDLSLPHSDRETIPGWGSEEFRQAFLRMRAAFEDAEGRTPNDQDKEFLAAVRELYERFFPESTVGPGSWVKKAIRGERFVGDPAAPRAQSSLDALPEPMAKRQGLDGQEDVHTEAPASGWVRDAMRGAR